MEGMTLTKWVLISNDSAKNEGIIHFWSTYENDCLLSRFTRFEDTHQLFYLRRHVILAKHPLFGLGELADVNVWSFQFFSSVFEWWR